MLLQKKEKSSPSNSCGGEMAGVFSMDDQVATAKS